MSYKSIIQDMKRKWNCSDLMDSYKESRIDKIPFSSPLLNYSTYGGIPRRKITIFYGDPGGGKTTTSIDICKNAVKMFQAEFEEQCQSLRSKIASGQKSLSGELSDLEERGPKKVLYIDLEHSFDEAWSATLGIDDSDVDIMQPPDVVAEDILQEIQNIIQTGEVGLIVLDSIPSLVPRTEIEKKIGERTVAALAGLLTVHLRKVVPLLTRYDTTMIYINQTRDNLDNPYVINMPGGQALKFYACLMIFFRIGHPVDFLGNELPTSTENPAGHIIVAKLTKQKSAPWDRKIASYYLMSNSGIRVDMDIAQLAVKKYGIIKKTGAWFTCCNPNTGEALCDENGAPIKLNGFSRVLDYLQSNKEYFSILEKYILDDISGKKSTEESESVDEVF